MTQRLRGLIFWLMVFLFFLSVPMVLFYALNYSYDWQNKKLVQNGAFYLKSLPKNAQIFINGKYKKTTPRLIEKMPPKNYAVEIKKDGFYPWKKELTIEPGLVAEASYILLINTNPSLETMEINPDFMEKFLPQKPSADKKERVKKLIAAYLQSKNSKKQYFENYQIIPSSNSYTAVLNYSTAAPAPTPKILARELTNQSVEQKGRLYLIDLEENLTPLADEVINAEFSSDNKKLLWQTNNEIWVYWLEDDYIQPYKKAGDKELITRFNEKIKQVIWYKGDNEHIIFIVNDAIKIIEIDSRGPKNITDIIIIKNPPACQPASLREALPAGIACGEATAGRQILSKNKILYILSENKLYKTIIGENSLF